ncbi:hypothetical protein VitviT2T_000653 [Vitis vinifera]|uniref:Protein kinase domain-containing protein n=1 Tax=Vitis vinifera TaxID=29760 RepID=A0ABY9BDZ2_VITVI|nr:hypothetical protein VitviT2T_000653 [Vitis vinifera]
MITSMALCNLLPLVFPLLLPLLADLLPRVSALESSIKSTFMYPFPCSESIKICNSSLYHINNGLQAEQIAFFYSVNRSEITYVKNQDYLVTVPCSCQKINDIAGYFYHTTYPVKKDDTFVNVSGQIYSGQAWSFGGEESKFIEGHEVDIYLPCGCVERKSQIVVTYTVQLHDTLSDIATLLSAKISGIESMNSILIQNSEYIDVGWVLFIPREKNGLSKDKEGTKHKWAIIISILAAVTVLSISTLIIIVLRRNRSQKNSEEDPKVSKSLSSNRTFSFRNQHLQENIEDVPGFESERPVIFSLEEIEDATNNFDETRKIGEGGYGSVYFGVLGEQEVAIKKMRSNKSKEFFAELKVELLGYASGDDHLYLVYEYVQNGSLNDHLHDPLLKGNQPLSWTARTQIALDAARGIEYIHDHTKARYVHRDIKTSNILLDETLRAKVADFGLAKLVGRTNEEDFIATRLVGTPGYLPPESVKELQVTSKTDVFAYGVVLAELITGQRALVRDNREPNKMRSLITVVNEIFHNEDPEIALEDAIDRTLRGSYPLEDAYKMAEIAERCLSEEAVDRPKMREIVVILTQIMTSALEWEASLGGNSQVFSGLFSGR